MSRAAAPIDILLVSHMHQAIGGAEMALLDMVEYLSGRGLKLHVVVGMEDTLSETLGKMGVPFTAIGLPWWVRGPKDESPFTYSGPNPIANTTLQLVELINNLTPKLCVTNTIVVPWLAYAAAVTGTPHAWLIHEMGTAGLQLRYDLGEEQTLRTIDEFSDAIFFNSKITASYYMGQFKHHEAVRLVYPGGKQPSPKPIASPFKDSAFKLAMVAQIKPQKAQLEAVQAVKRLVREGHDVQLAIIGAEEDPAYVAKINKYIESNHLHEVVLLTGYQKNPASYVALADAALTCATNEAFGRVTVEAMLLGKPVIGARSGGTIEIIKDTQTGLYYDPGSATDLANKVRRLMDDTALRAKIGRQAKAAASRAYADAARYAEFCSYYETLPPGKLSVNLSPLASVFSDFQSTTKLYSATNRRLQHILNSKTWRIMHKARALSKFKGHQPPSPDGQ